MGGWLLRDGGGSALRATCSTHSRDTRTSILLDTCIYASTAIFHSTTSTISTLSSWHPSTFPFALTNCGGKQCSWCLGYLAFFDSLGRRWVGKERRWRKHSQINCGHFPTAAPQSHTTGWTESQRKEMNKGMPTPTMHHHTHSNHSWMTKTTSR